MSHQITFQTGKAWATSIAWSGNSHYLVEKLFDGSQSIGAGELLLPGEVILSAGESYSAPALISVFSGQGLDGIASSYHQHLRSRDSRTHVPVAISLR